jgi:hypothetical protein
MNSLLPIMAGTLPVASVVLAFMIRLNRAERRRARVSKHVANMLRDTIQRSAGRELDSRLLRPTLVIERTATSYRGYLCKLEPSRQP